MKSLIEITKKHDNGGTTVKTITWHGFILFNKSCTHRFFRIGKNLGAWHILGFRVSFHVGNKEYYHKDGARFAPAWYKKPILRISL